MSDIKKCNRCGVSLERGWTEIYDESGKVQEYICFSCDANERKETYLKNGFLGSKLIMNAQLGYYDDDPAVKAQILRENGQLHEAIKRFEEAVWFSGGLHVYIKASQYSGHSMVTTGIKAMVLCTAGRVLVTLQDEHAMDVTVIFSETGRRRSAGMQSVNATVFQAVNMLDTFSNAVKKNGLQFKHDTQVWVV